jgi:hypothetical protein
MRTEAYGRLQYGAWLAPLAGDFKQERSNDRRLAHRSQFGLLRIPGPLLYSILSRGRRRFEFQSNKQIAPRRNMH